MRSWVAGSPGLSSASPRRLRLAFLLGCLYFRKVEDDFADIY